MYSDNNWVIIKNSSQKGKVIETTELWGTTILTVWVPVSDAIVRLSPAEVEPTSQSRFFGDENMLRYLTFLERKQLTWFPRYEKGSPYLKIRPLLFGLVSDYAARNPSTSCFSDEKH